MCPTAISPHFLQQPSTSTSKSASDDFDDNDLDLSASLWFQTLDNILSAKGAASRGRSAAVPSPGEGSERSGVGEGYGKGRAGGKRRELPQTAAVMGGVLDALLQRTLSSMAGEDAVGREQEAIFIVVHKPRRNFS